MTKVVKYLKALIDSNSKESSKRFLALYTMLFLVTFAVLKYTNSNNLVMVLAQLLSFVIAVLGVATWQKIKGK